MSDSLSQYLKYHEQLVCSGDYQTSFNEIKRAIRNGYDPKQLYPSMAASLYFGGNYFGYKNVKVASEDAYYFMPSKY